MLPRKLHSSWCYLGKCTGFYITAIKISIGLLIYQSGVPERVVYVTTTSSVLFCFLTLLNALDAESPIAGFDAIDGRSASVELSALRGLLNPLAVGFVVADTTLSVIFGWFCCFVEEEWGCTYFILWLEA